jgi:RNA polymerase sigma-70 factor (ECF subfamily)
MPAYSEEQLVLEALDDSHPAFEQLIKQYQYRVLRTIASIISDDLAAHDVAQETFLSAWSDLHKLKEKQKFGGWLNQIAINLSKHWLRDQRKHQEHTASFRGMTALMQERSHQQRKLRQEVWEAIDELSEEHREVVILHYISGYSYEEISEMLSIPTSTIVGRLQKARNQLRKEFVDMVAQLQLEIDSTLHGFLKEHAKQDGVSIEGLIIRLVEKYKRDIDSPEIAVRRVPVVNAWGASWGAPSPDGRYLSRRNYGNGNVAVRDLTTGEYRNLTTGEYRNLTSEGRRGGLDQWAEHSIWSPDSKQVAYTWYHKGFQLRIVGLDGSEPRVLYRNENRGLGWIWPHEWSRNKIVLVSVAAGSLKKLKSIRFWVNMSLSPDGRYVVYDNEGEPRDIFLLATDGSGEIPLVEHPADDYGPVWSPDGKSPGSCG